MSKLLPLKSLREGKRRSNPWLELPSADLAYKWFSRPNNFTEVVCYVPLNHSTSLPLYGTLRSRTELELLDLQARNYRYKQARSLIASLQPKTEPWARKPKGPL